VRLPGICDEDFIEGKDKLSNEKEGKALPEGSLEEHTRLEVGNNALK
jgi:hypothetical protein